MKKFLQQEFLNNTLEAYLYVVATILVVLLCKRIITKFLARLIYRWTMAREGKIVGPQSFLDLVVGPLETFLVLLISMIALDKLTFPGVLEFKVFHATSRQLIDSVADGVLIGVFIWLCLRVIDFLALILKERTLKATDHSDNHQLIGFFKDFLKAVLVIIGILLIIRTSFHQNISSVLTGLSLVGAAVALATKESMENLIASFIIFFDKPFKTGDLVKVSSFTGNIEKIGLRSTRIRTMDKTFITVPNKQMVDTIIDNITLRTQRKVELRLELELSATADQLAKLTPAIKDILQKPAIENRVVYLMDTGKSAHIMAIDYFSTMEQPIEDFFRLREQVNLEVIGLLEKSGINLAASSTDVIVHNTNGNA